jgi:DNA-binding transcriptional MerR regulator
VQATFTSKQAAELCGLPYPTLGFLRARGLLTPSIRVGGNKGAANVYSFEDIVALRCLSALRAVPSTFQAMKGVIAFWTDPEARALIAASEKAVSAKKPLPRRRVLVVTATGKVALAGNKTVNDLVEKHESAVLHIVDVSRLVDEVLVEASELRLLRLHVEPGPNGRLPRELTNERKTKVVPAISARPREKHGERNERKMGGRAKKDFRRKK